MSMLSSVAERLYWMSRYMERAENVARLVNAYSHFVFDIPKGSEPGWDSLITVIAGHEQFQQRYKVYSERNVMKFLLADMNNLGSLRHSVKSARECVRTTRDVLPERCWELINELYIFVNESSESACARRNRFQFLDQVIAMMEQIMGLIESNLSRHHPYRFIRIGRMLERADMTTRVVDVATTKADKQLSDASAGKLDNQVHEVDEAIWIWSHLLKSLSAVTAYRRHVGPLIIQDDVVNFIFKMPDFPRSLRFCLSEIARHSRGLSNHDEVEKRAVNLSNKFKRFEAEKYSLEALNLYIDKFQKNLSELNAAIYDAWFLKP